MECPASPIPPRPVDRARRVMSPDCVGLPARRRFPSVSPNRSVPDNLSASPFASDSLSAVGSHSHQSRETVITDLISKISRLSSRGESLVLQCGVTCSGESSETQLRLQSSLSLDSPFAFHLLHQGPKPSCARASILSPIVPLAMLTEWRSLLWRVERPSRQAR